ncbi:MAG: hypothetical protein ACHQ1H_13770 [Nitrososphaerales archaeon]
MKKQLVICPLCSRAFPMDEIVDHVLSHSKDAATKASDAKPSGA